MRATWSWNLLFLRRWREQRHSFPRWRAGRRIFHFCSATRYPPVPTFRYPLLKKEQFPFPPGSQVHGTTVCDALLPHSRPWPILPVAKRVQFGDDIPPHAPLASSVWDTGSSVRMPQNAPPSILSTPTPFRCTTTGMSIVPLELLAQRLEAWLTLPSLSRWLTRTIRLGYTIQFARRPPKFNGVLEMSVAVRNAPVLHEEIAVLIRASVRFCWQPSSLLLGRICPRVQSYVVLPQAWASPYQCLHMLPPFRHYVAPVAPFSGRLASLPLRQAVTTNRKDLKLSFTEGRNPFRFRG